MYVTYVCISMYRQKDFSKKLIVKLNRIYNSRLDKHIFYKNDYKKNCNAYIINICVKIFHVPFDELS